MPKYEFQVEVQTRYLPEQSLPEQNMYRFAYTITITNIGTGLAQVVARRWLITDADGHQQEVRGLGIVGKQPALEPGATHTYTSGCELTTPSGHMEGHFLCLTEAGAPFECPIAPFALQAQAGEHPVLTPTHHGKHTLH